MRRKMKHMYSSRMGSVILAVTQCMLNYLKFMTSRNMQSYMFHFPALTLDAHPQTDPSTGTREHEWWERHSSPPFPSSPHTSTLPIALFHTAVSILMTDLWMRGGKLLSLNQLQSVQTHSYTHTHMHAHMHTHSSLSRLFSLKKN